MSAPSTTASAPLMMFPQLPPQPQPLSLSLPGRELPKRLKRATNPDCIPYNGPKLSGWPATHFPLTDDDVTKLLAFLPAPDTQWIAGLPPPPIAPIAPTAAASPAPRHHAKGSLVPGIPPPTPASLVAAATRRRRSLPSPRVAPRRSPRF